MIEFTRERTSNLCSSLMMIRFEGFLVLRSCVSPRRGKECLVRGRKGFPSFVSRPPPRQYIPHLPARRPGLVPNVHRCLIQDSGAATLPDGVQPSTKLPTRRARKVPRRQIFTTRVNLGAWKRTSSGRSLKAVFAGSAGAVRDLDTTESAQGTVRYFYCSS